MKRIALFLAVGALHAASDYVSSTGNDSTETSTLAFNRNHVGIRK